MSNPQLVDINLRQVSEKVEFFTEDGTIISTAIIKRLQIQKIYLDLESGEEEATDWQLIPEFNEDEIQEEQAEESTDEIPLDSGGAPA